MSIFKYSVPNYIKEKKNLMKKILKIDFESIESPNKGSFEIILRKKMIKKKTRIKSKIKKRQKRFK